MSVDIPNLVHNIRSLLRPKTKILNGHAVGKNKIISNKVQRWPLSTVRKTAGYVPESKVCKRNGSRVGCECILPILIYVKTIERGFAADVFKRDIADITGSAWIGFYKGDIVSLNDGNITSMLGPVSVRIFDVTWG